MENGMLYSSPNKQNPLRGTLWNSPDNTTFVSITNSGFTRSGDERVKKALDSTEGFTFVLAGAKALLEHNVILNLVQDRFPDGVGG
jgi:hypothetical protein